MKRFQAVLMLGMLAAVLSWSCDIKKDHGKKCDTDTVCEGICLVNMPGGICTSYCAILDCPEDTSCLWIVGNYYCMPTCGSNGDCRSGYTCVHGNCRPPAPLGIACEEDSDCSSNLCESGICSDSCTANEECPDGMYCDLSLASPVCLVDDCSSGVCDRPCADHEDCAEGTYCTETETGDFFCAIIPDDGGFGTTNHSCAVEECRSGYDCISRYTEDSEAYCTEDCTSDVDCPPNMVCRGSEDGQDRCYRRGFCEPCSFDGQCGFRNEMCVSADPAVAEGEAYCSTTCVLDDLASCPVDSTCQEARYCEETGTWVADCSWCSGTCGTVDPSVFQCFHDYGACVGDGGLCTPCKHGGQCTTGACLRGYSDDNFTCSEPCTADGVCPDNYICVDITGEGNQCVPRTGSCSEPSGGKETCEFCSGHSDCIRGFCLPPDGDIDSQFNCLNECGTGFPACPSYQTCETLRFDTARFDVCVPAYVGDSCVAWDTCVGHCPAGPDTCDATSAPSAPDYCY